MVLFVHEVILLLQNLIKLVKYLLLSTNLKPVGLDTVLELFEQDVRLIFLSMDDLFGLHAGVILDHLELGEYDDSEFLLLLEVFAYLCAFLVELGLIPVQIGLLELILDCISVLNDCNHEV